MEDNETQTSLISLIIKFQTLVKKQPTTTNKQIPKPNLISNRIQNKHLILTKQNKY